MWTEKNQIGGEVKLKNLRYELHGKQPEKHPQIVMGELGIKYILASPEPLGDCWLFVGCSNVPKELPEYIIEIPILKSMTVHDRAEKSDRPVRYEEGDTIELNDRPFTDFDDVQALCDDDDDDDSTYNSDSWAGDGGEADGGGASGDWSDDD